MSDSINVPLCEILLRTTDKVLTGVRGYFSSFLKSNFNKQILLLLRLILERMKILKEHRFYLDAKVLNLALKHDLS